MAGGAACGLDERGFVAQESLLVRIEDANQRNFRQVEPFPQQVDSHQHVEISGPQSPDDFSPFERFNLRMQITHFDSHFAEVVRQVLGHFFRQRRYQYPLVYLDPAVDFTEQVVNLSCDRTHFQHWIDQSGRPDDLLRHLRRGLQLIGRRGRGNIHDLSYPPFEFLEFQWTVIQRRRQPEPEINQGLLARPVTVVHGMNLRHGYMGFVDNDEKIVRKIIHQGKR